MCKNAISVSLYGCDIFRYYLPFVMFLKANVNLDNNLDYIIHVDNQSYDLIFNIIKQEEIQSNNIKYVIHNNDNQIESGSLWRYQSIFDKQYNYVIITDTDNIQQSNILSIYNQKLLENIQNYSFCMTINGLQKENPGLIRSNIQGGNVVFFPNNISNFDYMHTTFNQILNDIKVTKYGDDEIMLWTFICEDYFKDNYIYFYRNNYLNFIYKKYIENIHKNIIYFDKKDIKIDTKLKYIQNKSYIINNNKYDYLSNKVQKKTKYSDLECREIFLKFKLILNNYYKNIIKNKYGNMS